MKVDNENTCVIIKDCSNGDIKIIPRFFQYSHYSQESILNDFIMPMLYDNHNIVISIVNN